MSETHGHALAVVNEEAYELEMLRELFARPTDLTQRVAPHEAPWGPWAKRPLPSQEYHASPPALPPSPHRWKSPDMFSPKKETTVNAFAPSFGDARSPTPFFEPSHTAPFFVAPPVHMGFEEMPETLCKPRLGARHELLLTPPPLEISTLWTGETSTPKTSSPLSTTSTTTSATSGRRGRCRQRARCTSSNAYSYSEVSGNKLDFDAFLAERNEQRELADGLRRRADALGVAAASASGALSVQVCHQAHGGGGTDGHARQHKHGGSPKPRAGSRGRGSQEGAAADTPAGRARARKDAVWAAHTARLELEMRDLLLGLVDHAADVGEAALRSRWYGVDFSRISARGVPQADEGRSTLSDPYVLFEVVREREGDARYGAGRTEAILGTETPAWEQPVRLVLPAGSDAALEARGRPRVRISVYDKDRATADELLGSAELNLKLLGDGGEVTDLTMGGGGRFPDFSISFQYSSALIEPAPAATLRIRDIAIFNLGTGAADAQTPGAARSKRGARQHQPEHRLCFRLLEAATPREASTPSTAEGQTEYVTTDGPFAPARALCWAGLALDLELHVGSVRPPLLSIELLELDTSGAPPPPPSPPGEGGGEEGTDGTRVAPLALEDVRLDPAEEGLMEVKLNGGPKGLKVRFCFDLIADE